MLDKRPVDLVPLDLAWPAGRELEPRGDYLMLAVRGQLAARLGDLDFHLVVGILLDRFLHGELAVLGDGHFKDILVDDRHIVSKTLAVVLDLGLVKVDVYHLGLIIEMKLRRFAWMVML